MRDKLFLNALFCPALIVSNLLLAQEPPAQYVVAPTVTYEEPQRIGLNLGTWTTYGTQQYSSNIIMNPGFEGDIDRVFVFVNTTTWNTFFDQSGWGYDDNYWNGATYRVMSGASAGITGTVVTSLAADPGNGLPAYITDGALPPLDPLDAIVLTKRTNTNPVPIWWIPHPELVCVDPAHPRPGSPGIQSLKMMPDSTTPAEVDFYFDAESDHAGKFLIVSGRWKFSIWAKSEATAPTLQVMFRRINGTDPFFLTTFNLTADWKEYTIEFDAEDNGAPQTLQLQIQAISSDDNTWIDDASLGPVQSDSTFPFRKEVVELIKELKPSYLRDTQGQLGDSYINRVENLFGRRAVSSRSFNGPRSLSTCYSINDLLTLCKATDANPWIIIPPVFSNEEAYKLGLFLKKHASKKHFAHVIVEFGNENWNYQFRATGIPYADVHGAVAEQTFSQIVAGAGRGVNLIKVVNGQYVNPSLTMDFLNSSPSADAVAVGPYFFPELNNGGTELDNLTELFSLDSYMNDIASLVAGVNKRLFVYETNLTTIDGNASESVRATYTVGAAAGAALAQRLLKNMTLKVDPQCIYSFNQYDIYSFGANGYVKLWGITRDLSPTLRLRPQGLAMAMINKVVGDSVYQVFPVDGETLDNLTIVAFRTDKRWNIAAVNPNPDAATVQVTFPEDDRGIPLKVYTLDYATSPLDTNEDDENVTIKVSTATPNNRTCTFVIPAWGFVVAEGAAPLPL
jgi:hypothetical protein